MVSEEEFRRRMEETPPEEYFELQKHGQALYEAWTGLAFQEPPEDILGRILWSAGILGQLVVSLFTFPAALGAFMLEEAVQSYGMGAYMLSTSKSYDALSDYLDGYKVFIDAAEIGAKNLATLTPVTGGAVLIYMFAAKAQALAFEYANDRNILKQAETDEALRKKLEDQAKYATLRLQSSPTGASIFRDGVDLSLVTPETFKQMDAGTYAFTLKKWSALRNVEETTSFNVTLEAGYKKEIFARIPKIIDGVQEESEDPDETSDKQLPDFIKAEVTGDHAIDGDTFATTTGERIRLLAIDAPEIGRPWSSESKEALGIMIEDKKIQLRIQGRKPLDQYGRTLAICNNYKGDISVFQLSAGLATVFIPDDDIYDPSKYIAAEQVAKDRKIGIWS